MFLPNLLNLTFWRFNCVVACRCCVYVYCCIFFSNFSHSLVLIDIGVISGSMLIKTFTCCAVLCLVTQSCPTLYDPMDCSPLGSSVHWDSPGKNTGMSYHALLQGIFPTQGSNPSLPHYRQIFYRLSHQGSQKHSCICLKAQYMHYC